MFIRVARERGHDEGKSFRQTDLRKLQVDPQKGSFTNHLFEPSSQAETRKINHPSGRG